MNLSTEIRTAILAVSAVTDIVGTGDDAKIWDSWDRTNDTPMIVIELDEEEEEPELDGTCEWVTAEVTITCRAENQVDSHALQRVVRSALNGYVGTFDANLNHSVPSRPPKEDGSKFHWYDEVMNWTMTFSEAA